MRRRDFLKTTALMGGGLAGLVAGCGDSDDPGGSGGFASCGDSSFGGEDDGAVAHILPTASSERMLLKVSLKVPASEVPELLVDGCSVAGRATDQRGSFWMFDADGLDPGRAYRLELRAGGRHLIDPWELATLPAPEARPERFRLLMYGCAGGHPLWEGAFNSVAIRRRLLRRALSFAPDAVVASGDHVYWDQISNPLGSSPPAVEIMGGSLDRAIAVLGTANEDKLIRAVDPQIAGMYGTDFRSVPTFFVRDDHDYFEDDRVLDSGTTFPASAFMTDLARSTQWLYYPELLPDRHRRADLPGSSAADRPHGVAETFGTLRYGQLFEGLIYDCKGLVTLDGEAGTVVPPAVERWLIERMADPSPRYVVNLPSNPPGWTAGKLAEWYPEVLDPATNEFTDRLAKPGWQRGWLAQHDRLLAAATAMDRLPLFMASDLHSTAEERILRSGEVDLEANPAVAVIVGTPGTGVGWVSGIRGAMASPPAHLEVEEVVPVIEENGFHVVDFEEEVATIRHFRWDNRDDPAKIDTLDPFFVSRHPRRA